MAKVGKIITDSNNHPTMGGVVPSSNAGQSVVANLRVINVATDGDGDNYGDLAVNSGSDLVILASAARTTTQTQPDQTNFSNARGIKVLLDMTVVGTGSVTLTIQGKDLASGKYYTLLAGAAVTTNTTNVYTVYPGISATANVSANDVLPHTWRALVTANNANSATYSLGASLLP